MEYLMKNIISPACLPNFYSYDILGSLRATIAVESNVYQIPLETLFLMAARNNIKRGFLFVSKVLGKHIPVHPFIPLIGGGTLAARYASMVYNQKTWEENCDFTQAFVSSVAMEETWEYMRHNPLPLAEKTLFIGFAETATALGHSVFASFADKAHYIHTTRENIEDISNVLHFAEEHSHATEHYCYALDTTLFENEDMIALVDDEITTGKSALNFIRAIQKKYPRKKYAVISLLDWRSAVEKQKFADVEAELGISIHMVSLVSGSITVQGQPVIDELPNILPIVSCDTQAMVERITIEENLGELVKLSSLNTKLERNRVPYLYATGRFGINSKEQFEQESGFQKIGLSLREKRQGQKTLCLGTGEFMYIPFKIASYMGEGVSVQSTTRSPVHPATHPGYAVQQAISFPCPEDNSIMNYVYNIPAEYYDEVFIFLEREVDTDNLAGLLQAFAPLSIPNIYYVTCVTE